MTISERQAEDLSAAYSSLRRWAMASEALASRGAKRLDDKWAPVSEPTFMVTVTFSMGRWPEPRAIEIPESVVPTSAIIVYVEQQLAEARARVVELGGVVEGG